MHRRAVVPGAACLLLPAAAPASGDNESYSHRRVGDILIHLAVLPIAPTQPDHLHRLIVTLRRADSGAPVEGAVVRATVSGVGHPQPQVTLLAAALVDARPGYVGSVSLPPRDSYRIELQVGLPHAAPLAAVFLHRQLQP